MVEKGEKEYWKQQIELGEVPEIDLEVTTDQHIRILLKQVKDLKRTQNILLCLIASLILTVCVLIII